MAKNEIEIINRALVKVGVNPIQGLNENSAESIVVKDMYSGVRDGVLCAYPWTFAKRKSILTKTSTLSVDGKNSFVLPNDALRILSVNTDEYEIAGGVLLSDEDSICINYIGRPAEMDFPAYFDGALVAKLASEICLPLTDSTTRTEFFTKVSEKEFRTARLIDVGQDITGSIAMNALIEGR